MMDEQRKIQRIPKADLPPSKSKHRRYWMFNNSKSMAIELAREIYSDEGEHAPDDVLRFVDDYGRNAA